jgi:hypothetical protein
MKKVKIKNTGIGSKGAWVLVEWELEGCDFLDSAFLIPKDGKLKPTWKPGVEIEVPTSLLK